MMLFFVYSAISNILVINAKKSVVQFVSKSNVRYPSYLSWCVSRYASEKAVDVYYQPMARILS